KRRILLGQHESGDSASVDGYETFRAGLRKKMAQHRFRKRDTRWKTFLVQLPKSREIFDVVLADGDAHGPDSSHRAVQRVSTLHGANCTEQATRGNCSEENCSVSIRNSAMLLLLQIAASFTSFLEAPVRNEIIRRDESASVSLA